MSHLHIPDGVMPNFLWIGGYLLTVVLLFVATKRVQEQQYRWVLPKMGVVAALMLLAMSIPLGPFHLNLTVLAGIILGPSIGFVAVFIVNIILALFGHGGITVVGLNTLIIGSEVVVGYLVYTGLKRIIKTAPSAVVATAVALSLSFVLTVGIIGMARLDFEVLAHHHHGDYHHEHAHHDHHPHDDEATPVLQQSPYIDGQNNDHTCQQGLSLRQVAGTVLPFVMSGIFLESLLTTVIVGYLIKVRPGTLS